MSVLLYCSRELDDSQFSDIDPPSVLKLTLIPFRVKPPFIILEFHKAQRHLSGASLACSGANACVVLLGWKVLLREGEPQICGM